MIIYVIPTLVGSVLSRKNISFSFIVPIALINVECIGDEQTILECPSRDWTRDSSCDHDDDLLISCLREFSKRIIVEYIHHT